jgi:hypothetical protein
LSRSRLTGLPAQCNPMARPGSGRDELNVEIPAGRPSANVPDFSRQGRSSRGLGVADDVAQVTQAGDEGADVVLGEGAGGRAGAWLASRASATGNVRRALAPGEDGLFHARRVSQKAGPSLLSLIAIATAAARRPSNGTAMRVNARRAWATSSTLAG